MTVLVTGGLGFIGSKVVTQLLKRDIDVLVTDLDIEKNKDKLKRNILKIGKDSHNMCRQFLPEIYLHNGYVDIVKIDYLINKFSLLQLYLG